MPFMIKEHDVDPRQKILDEIGDISGLQIFNNQVLCAIYIRPQKTKSGIYMTDSYRDEDRYQSKVGLVLKKGPSAFVDETGEWFHGTAVEVNDWIVLRPSDGWAINVNGVACRIVDDISVRGLIDNPDRVW